MQVTWMLNQIGKPRQLCQNIFAHFITFQSQVPKGKESYIMPRNPRCCARCNSSGGSSSKEVHWLSVLFWWVTDPSLMLLSQSPWEIVDLFNSLYPHHPLSGHLKQNTVNTSTPLKLPGCKNVPSTFHQSTEDTSGAIHEMFETSSCVSMACLPETWVGSNDRGTTHLFPEMLTHTDHYHIIAYSLECQVLQLFQDCSHETWLQDRTRTTLQVTDAFQETLAKCVVW